MQFLDTVGIALVW